jgi:hypothetical protein
MNAGYCCERILAGREIAITIAAAEAVVRISAFYRSGKPLQLLTS